jgi:hypothetical protein
MATSHFFVSASTNRPGVSSVLRLQCRLRSGLLGLCLSRVRCGPYSAVSARHGGAQAQRSDDRGAHSMWPVVDHQGAFKLPAQTTRCRSSANAAAFSARCLGLSGRRPSLVASSSVSERSGAGVDMSLSPQGSGFHEASDACRLTRRMQRTAQSVMRFAFANRPPLCSAADARR